MTVFSLGAHAISIYDCDLYFQAHKDEPWTHLDSPDEIQNHFWPNAFYHSFVFFTFGCKWRDAQRATDNLSVILWRLWALLATCTPSLEFPLASRCLLNMTHTKKENIWLSPVTKAPKPTEKSKKHRDNIKNFDYKTTADRLRTVIWSNSSKPHWWD